MKKSNPVLSLAAWVAGWMPAPIKQALYRRRSLAGLVRGGLNRAAPQGLTTVKVAAGGLRGCLLLLDLQSEKDYWLGTYEPELQVAITDLVHEGGVAYDVGANIGYISLLLARRLGAGGRVYAFEALPANLERLRTNISLNGMQDQVVVQNAAVVESERTVRFLVGPSGGMGKAEGSAGRQEVAYSQALDVSGVSLDNFVYQRGNPPPQVVKMDIEGGEVLALPGMRRLLAEARPLLLLELHGLQAAASAWEELMGVGYRVCRMQPGYPSISSLEVLDWKAYLIAMPG